MQKVNLTICSLLLFVLAGCGTAASSKFSLEKDNFALLKNTSNAQAVQSFFKGDESVVESQSNKKINPTSTLIAPLNLTPLSKYKDEWENKTSAGASFSNSYTRLLIRGEVLSGVGELRNGGEKPLLYEERDWWMRALVGKEFSINLTTKVSVGAFEATVPLATIGHQSNSDGEQWSRAIHHTKSNFPLFLVKTDGSASIPVVKLSVSGTKSYSSRGAAAAVQAVVGIANSTSQPLSVVTRLSEQSTKDKARAIDSAISKIFSSGITEEHWTDRDLRLWSVDENNQPRGVAVEFLIPGDEQKWNSNLHPVGRWIVTFDYPRPSIFSDWRICNIDTLARCAKTRMDAEKLVHQEIEASEVLNYILWNGDNNLGTIKAFISQQDWYISAQTALVAPDTSVTAAGALCRRIASEIVGLGLNGFDAKIVVWAITKGMPLPKGAPDFLTVPDCESAIVPIKSVRT